MNITDVLCASVPSRELLSVESVAARPHGRVDAVFLCAQVVLCFVFTLASNFSVVVLLGCAVVIGVVFTVGLFEFVPYMYLRVACMHCGAAATFAWACLVAVLLQVRNNPKVCLCHGCALDHKR